MVRVHLTLSAPDRDYDVRTTFGTLLENFQANSAACWTCTIQYAYLRLLAQNAALLLSATLLVRARSNFFDCPPPHSLHLFRSKGRRMGQLVQHHLELHSSACLLCRSNTYRISRRLIWNRESAKRGPSVNKTPGCTFGQQPG